MSQHSFPTMARTPIRPALAGMIAWVVLCVFQFGFGISELNALEHRLTCTGSAVCFGLSTNAFGLVTTTFTIGGTLSSLACGSVARYMHAGRRACLQASATCVLAGGILLCVSTSFAMLSLARLLQGIGAGIGVVQVPLYLQEISPPALSGEVGILNQVAVVCGIFVAQATGTLVVSANAPTYYVPQVSAVLAACQLLIGALWACESPGWLEGEGAYLAASAPLSPETIRKRLWGAATYEVLPTPPDETAQRTAPDWRRDPQLRRGLWLVGLTQAAQQLSGVNAILYYSTGILSSLMPTLASQIGLLITVVNGALTFPPIFLISEERVGRKALLVGSASGMGLCCFVLAYSLTYGYAALSAIAILCVIACFSMGLGPVPFVILPEVIPAQYGSLGSSFGLSVNWISNIIVAAGFPPLRTALGAWDRGTGGLVFVVFGAANLVAAALIQRDYVY